MIYLNFVGGNVSNTAWNTGYGVATWNCLPYDPSGTPGFTAGEKIAIGQVWARVAEDYSPWAVDVTTERPAALNSSTAVAMVTKSTDATGMPLPSSRAGGIAYINVFGQMQFRLVKLPCCRGRAFHWSESIQ